MQVSRQIQARRIEITLSVFVKMSNNKKHKLLYNHNNILIYINCYMFRASLVHLQGVKLYKTIVTSYYRLQHVELS